MRKVTKLIIALLVSIVIAIPLISLSNKFNEDPTRIQLEDVSDTYSGPEFLKAYYLNTGGGKDVNFWVKNIGDVDVTIALDGKKLKEPLKPGEEGNVTSKSGLFSRNFNFKVKSETKGSDIKVEYKISQVDK